MLKTLFAFSVTLSSALISQTAFSAEIEVKMLNKGENGQAMVFEPAAIEAQVGDVIRFIPKDRGHDAVAIKGLIPEGAEEFKGKINQVVEVKISHEGAYVIKCSPHFGMGMVAVIKAGSVDASQVDVIRAAKMPKKSKERLEESLSALGL